MSRTDRADLDPRVKAACRAVAEHRGCPSSAERIWDELKLALRDAPEPTKGACHCIAACRRPERP